jgi:hypothetical protein
MFFITLTMSLFASQVARATPVQVTAWFLKEAKVSFLPSNTPQWLSPTAQAFECVPMGEGCFHPQMGYFERNAMDVNTRETTVEEKQKNKNGQGDVERSQLKTFNSNETDHIDCDKNNIFDMYCGRESKTTVGRDGEFEVWLDVSSSLRIIDPDERGQPCKRKTMLDKVLQACGDRVIFKTYNTAIKEIADTNYACINHGLNDSERLIKWIESSKAKHLFLITDITEFNTGLSDYLQSIGAKVKGVDTKDLMAKDLSELAGEIGKLCK